MAYRVRRTLLGLLPDGHISLGGRFRLVFFFLLAHIAEVVHLEDQRVFLGVRPKLGGACAPVATTELVAVLHHADASLPSPLKHLVVFFAVFFLDDLLEIVGETTFICASLASRGMDHSKNIPEAAHFGTGHSRTVRAVLGDALAFQLLEVLAEL